MLEPQEQDIDVLDDNGLRTKEVLPREEIHRLGKLHRAVHLYLLDLQGNILLQQRSAQVDHCPGMLSISLTAHVDTGESSSTALNREIEEELQLDPSHMRCHFLFSYRHDEILSPTYIDRQFNDVYLCFYNFSLQHIRYNPQETAAISLVPFADFEMMIKDKDSILPSTYVKALPDLLLFLGKLF